MYKLVQTIHIFYLSCEILLRVLHFVKRDCCLLSSLLIIYRFKIYRPRSSQVSHCPHLKPIAGGARSRSFCADCTAVRELPSCLD